MTSLLGAELVVSGAIETSGDVKILGRVDGPVTARAISVGPSSCVIGDLTAETIEIAGVVRGTVTATVVEIRATASVGGEICYGSLASGAGARIERCVRLTPQRAG